MSWGKYQRLVLLNITGRSGSLVGGKYWQLHAHWRLDLTLSATFYSVAAPSFLTIMVPMACNHSLEAALTIRVLIGFFESASFPAIYHFFPIWVPNTEKTFLIPFIVSGIYLGEIVGFSLSGILAESNIYIGGDYYGGWQSIFYVFGLVGLLWFPLWIYMAYESPSVHPYISTEELNYMRTGK
jgi:MFS family permease